jgi:hypothetical protein
MPPQTLESKVEDLETRVTRLEELPARIDDLTSQVSQLRTEMRDEFSAVRTEMADGFATVRSELGADIEARTDALAVQMRMLHEDVIARIALLHAGAAEAADAAAEEEVTPPGVNIKALRPLRCGIGTACGLLPQGLSRVACAAVEGTATIIRWSPPAWTPRRAGRRRWRAGRIVVRG